MGRLSLGSVPMRGGALPGDGRVRKAAAPVDERIFHDVPLSGKAPGGPGGFARGGKLGKFRTCGFMRP
ncbi:MAG TPA: hypothetical protein DDZ83_01730 [Nitrospinae bacterium]|nr:hypothetical protein [Nitrospinota bacterium]